MPHVVPSQAQVIARCLSDFRAEAGLNPLRLSIERALVMALAGQSKGQYSYQSFIFRQCFPTTAEDHYFWRWAAIWDITQKPGARWQGTVSLTGTPTTNVPSGTRFTRSDGAEYETVGAFVIDGGGGVVAVMRAVLPGLSQNLAVGDPLTLANAIAGVDSDTDVVAVTVTGTDDETAEDGLERLLQRLREPPSGGSAGDYERWALEVAGVTRVWATSSQSGQVTVRFVRDNDGAGAAIVPDAAEREAVRAYVQALAPITVVVDVPALTALTVTVTTSNLVPASSWSAVQASLQDMFYERAEPGGTIFLAWIQEAISQAVGEVSHTLTAPVANVIVGANEVPVVSLTPLPS